MASSWMASDGAKVMRSMSPATGCGRGPEFEDAGVDEAHAASTSGARIPAARRAQARLGVIDFMIPFDSLGARGVRFNDCHRIADRSGRWRAGPGFHASIDVR